MDPSETTAVIIGLGQIGGSLALALRKAAFFQQIGGFDINTERRLKAADFLDFTTENLDNAVARGDLIILAAPVLQNINILRTAISDFPQKLYTDTGSTKKSIFEFSREAEIKRFIGGHPMTGTENEGDQGWDDALFEGKPYYWIPDDRLDPGDVKLIVDMIEATGAVPQAVDPEEHDRLLALTSHLPLLISAAIMGTVSSQEGNIDDFVGSGLRTVTRLAGGSPEMGKDIMLTNKDLILRALDEFLNTISELAEHIRLDRGDKISLALGDYQKAYLALVREHPTATEKNDTK